MKYWKTFSLSLCVAAVGCSARGTDAAHKADANPPASSGATPTDSEPDPVGTAPACTPDAAAAVHVTITSKQGPGGAAAPLAFDNNLYDNEHR